MTAGINVEFVIPEVDYMPKKKHPRGYAFTVYLNVDLFFAMEKLSLTFKTGHAPALLLALTEGFHHLGCLDEEQYKRNFEQYSKPLTDVQTEHETVKETVTMEKTTIKIKKETSQIPDIYEPMLEDMRQQIQKWKTLTPQMKTHLYQKAKKYPQFQESQDIITLYTQENPNTTQLNT